MSWKPELSWTCPPRVVFDVLDRRDSNPQPQCHSKYLGRRMKGGRQPARARTRQRGPAGKARRSWAIRQTKPTTLQSDHAEQLSTPSPEGRSRLLRPALPHWTVLVRKCARRPRDWPKGAPSPLIGPGGVAGFTADRPSNRKSSNIVLRWLSLADQWQTRSDLSDWARETPSPY